MTIARAREELKSADKKKRAALRKQCEATIATWDWGSFMRHHVEPDFMLRHKWRRGSPLPGPPKPPIAGAYGHAFDAQGRMVVQHQQIPSDDIYEKFWVWSERDGVGYSYPPDKKTSADHVSVYTLDDKGRVVRVDTAHADGKGALTTEYSYDAEGRWIRALLTGRYSGDHGKAYRLEEVERDAKGRLIRLWHTQESGHRWAQIDKTTGAATKKAAVAKAPAKKKHAPGKKAPGKKKPSKRK